MNNSQHCSVSVSHTGGIKTLQYLLTHRALVKNTCVLGAKMLQLVGRATNTPHLVTEKYPLRSFYYTTVYFITNKYSNNKTTEHVYKVTWLQTELEK